MSEKKKRIQDLEREVSVLRIANNNLLIKVKQLQGQEAVFAPLAPTKEVRESGKTSGSFDVYGAVKPWAS